MKKKILFTLIILSLVFGGCKKDDNKKQTKAGDGEEKLIKIGLASDNTGISDATFVEMHYVGLLKLKNNNDNVNIIVKEVAKDVEKEYFDAMEYLVTVSKCDMVITTGTFEAIEPVNTLAEKYPEVKFVITDVEANPRNNVAALLFDQYEGSFLTGLLAAKVTKTKKLGFIGGVNQDVINEFVDGYINGIKYVDSSIKVAIEYLSEPPDYSGWSNPDKAYSIAKNMYNNGIDIIYVPAGFSITGSIKCAVEMGKYIIGVDSNLDYTAPGTILTCMMKRVDNAVYDIALKFLNNNFESGTYMYSLSNGGISLTDMKYTRDKITEEVINYVETMKNKIINNEISIK